MLRKGRTAMSELDKIRENINSIDEQMAQLFEKRMEMSEQVAAFKKARGLSIRDAEREREVIDRNRRYITDPAVASYYVQFLRGVLDLSCAYQSRLLSGMKVAYSGVEGAYGYLAARRMFPEARLVAYPDFAAAHRAVEVGEADSVVLPLENSYAGEVGAVMDLLFSGELYINQVLDMEIDHSLLGVENATVDTVRAVVSHPQALRQCDDYIKRHGYATETYSNTALAAAHVRDVNDPRWPPSRRRRRRRYSACGCWSGASTRCGRIPPASPPCPAPAASRRRRKSGRTRTSCWCSPCRTTPVRWRRR